MGAVILVVDDERPVLRLIESILKAAGHCVYTAETVEHAHAFIQLLGAELEVLICDVFLRAGRSGIEVIRELTFHCPYAVTILTSGEFEANDRTPFKLDGKHHLVLAKPFSKSQLLAVVTSAIDKSDASAV